MTRYQSFWSFLRTHSLKNHPLTCQHRQFSEGDSRRVVVTGLGAVTPLGCGVDHLWRGVIRGECGIGRLEGERYESLPCRVAGFVPRGSSPGRLDLKKHLSDAEMRTMSMATAFAIVAADEALADAGWSPEAEEDQEQTGVAIGVGMVDLEDVVASEAALRRSYNRLSPYFVPRILPNLAAGQVSIRHHLRGPNHCVSTACATGSHAVGDALRMVQNGSARVMVCGASEACISPLSVAAFCRQRALSCDFNHDPERASRPFDKKRDGFVIGEGAGVMVLEDLEHARKRGVQRIYAEVLGYGLSGDAHHLTAARGDGRGALLCMRSALRDARVDISHVGYVNAHATSTPLGDRAEATAIRSLLADNASAAVSSLKGALGHLLGAAGSVESIVAVMACYEAILPPSINVEEVGEGIELNLVLEKKKKWDVRSGERRIALKNSFGFGGTNASLCFAEFRP